MIQSRSQKSFLIRRNNYQILGNCFALRILELWQLQKLFVIILETTQQTTQRI